MAKFEPGYGNEYIYPINQQTRDYQFHIIHQGVAPQKAQSLRCVTPVFFVLVCSALFKNTLVSLPTVWV